MRRADGVLQESHLLGELGVVADHDHAADHVGVTIEVFGRRMHNQVSAMFQRTLQDRRGEGVVDRDQQAALARDRADRLQVDDLQGRVGRSFDPDQFRVRLDRGLERGRIGQVDEAEIQPRAAPPHALEQAIAAAVDVVHRDNMITAVEQLQQGRGRRQSGGKGEAAGAALQ